MLDRSWRSATRRQADWHVGLGGALALMGLASGCGTGASTEVDAGTIDGARRDAAMMRRDVHTLPTPDAAVTAGCSAVDVLFVIDNSTSMADKQRRLAAAFPAFVDAMFDALPPRTSLHVGLTTTAFIVASNGDSFVSCRSQASREYVLANYITPRDGDTGENGGQGRLVEYQGRHWFEADTASDRAPLKAWFSGAATSVGESSSSIECSSAGLAYACSVANAATNRGFVRDRGAVLVLVALTDEPDKSPESTAQYRAMVLGAKPQCGSECIVAAGLMLPCMREVGDPLWRFLDGFGQRALLGDINGTEVDYTRLVTGALTEAIGRACNRIVPG